MKLMAVVLLLIVPLLRQSASSTMIGSEGIGEGMP
jgi:hypothetical protein